MITETQIDAAEAPFAEGCSVSISSFREQVRQALEAAEAAAWLPYDEDTVPAYDVLLYWPAAGIDNEIQDMGRWRGRYHQWACDRRDPPTHYRLIVGPK